MRWIQAQSANVSPGAAQPQRASPAAPARVAVCSRSAARALGSERPSRERRKPTSNLTSGPIALCWLRCLPKISLGHLARGQSDLGWFVVGRAWLVVKWSEKFANIVRAFGA